MFTWRTRVSELERLVARLVGEVATLEKLVHDLSGRVERGSTVAIRADLDNLVGRVETLATSNRKEFGRLHAANRKDHVSSESGDGTGDADLAEQIKFQRDWSN